MPIIKRLSHVGTSVGVIIPSAIRELLGGWDTKTEVAIELNQDQTGIVVVKAPASDRVTTDQAA